MKHPKCIHALIGDQGDSITIALEDKFSCETLSIKLSTEEWSRILTYREAYDRPDRMMFDAHQKLCDYFFKTTAVLKDKE